jgi:phosphohistidine phosphatase SixA
MAPRPHGARLPAGGRAQLSLLLIRHALAGDPSLWKGDDRLRPLDDRGRRQATGLVDALSELELDRIVSSPFLRCVQTVEPLAQARGLPIEYYERLGADRLDEVPEMLEDLRGQDAAVCTHGDLQWLGERKFEKGSVWVLGAAGEPGSYIPPQA